MSYIFIRMKKTTYYKYLHFYKKINCNKSKKITVSMYPKLTFSIDTINHCMKLFIIPVENVKNCEFPLLFGILPIQNKIFHILSFSIQKLNLTKLLLFQQCRNLAQPRRFFARVVVPSSPRQRRAALRESNNGELFSEF